jgi:hypothetical protein
MKMIFTDEGNVLPHVSRIASRCPIFDTYDFTIIMTNGSATAPFDLHILDGTSKYLYG